MDVKTGQAGTSRKNETKVKHQKQSIIPVHPLFLMRLFSSMNSTGLFKSVIAGSNSSKAAYFETKQN